MADPIDFTVRAQAPTLDHYRRGWVPAPDVGLAGMWIGAVVSDASGQQYWGLRGTDDFLAGMTHVVSPITGFKKLVTSFEGDPPHLFDEYSTIDWFEPLEYQDSGDKTTLGFYSGRIERDSNGFHWYDASGRWEMHGRPVSDIFTVGVPSQDGIEHQAWYRHELLVADGIVDGVEVSGYLHQDYATAQRVWCIRNCRSRESCRACGCRGYMSTTTASGVGAASGKVAAGGHSGPAINSRPM